MSSQSILRINRGTRAIVPCVWPASSARNAPGADLTDYALALIDVSAGLAGKVSIAPVDLSTGQFVLTFDEGIEVTDAPGETLRIEITSPDGTPTTTDLLRVFVQ